ncbi:MULTISPECIES: copper chaperone PCu(A)C [unclassified Oceanobacter]|jgi:copper(I)-binding protein|uniref:copper chaperone PCu(A)C n=1 Tax=unclassified Oceanobacter TaxID=2620260 RepID=UPI002733F087|nr:MULTISPECIES: copper chaperone PCu(A)C [unclassified Oceanobacter]MDP2505015.1 copper chaperone PCu(A)C [Oceanobacter sp. 3_MG-2023]MDP2548556.1 copper chaperone PCu(A)C [Oceanobacter sp. 4_MG-2023]
MIRCRQVRPLSTHSQPLSIAQRGVNSLRWASLALVLAATSLTVQADGKHDDKGHDMSHMKGMESVEHSAGGKLDISHATVRAPIPGRTMSAAFMTLTNKSAKPDRLVSAKSSWTDHIEIHTHIHEDGVMKMRQINGLDIPAGRVVTLKPGGLHLMLFGLKQPLPAAIGGSLPLTLCFEHTGCQNISAKLVDMRQ